MNCRKLLWSCLFAINSFGALAADNSECANGTVLFREDFGGNNVSDPALGPALPADVITLPFSNHQWAKLKNGYDIRKEAIKRQDYNPHNHIYAGWYADFGDHTHEDDLTRGYFMVVDLDNKEATFYKTKVNNLCENTGLTFSFWGRSLNASSSAPITITIEDVNGNLLAEKKFTLSSSVYAWSRFDLPFTVPEGETSIVYKVYSGAGGNGGDIALDDIEVRLCKSPVNVNTPDTLCLGSDFTLKASFDNADNSYVEPLTYTWFKNDKKNYNEEGWTKVSTGSTLSFPNLSKADEGFYKVFVSSAGVEGSFNMCNSSSDIVEIKLKTCECMPNDTLIQDTICSGESFSFGGKTLTEAGTYKDKLVNIDGCDSLVTLELTILDKVETNLEEAICKGGSFVFGSKTLTEAGVYTDNLVSVAGCDSIVTLTLTVTEKVETNLEEAICKGGSFVFGSKTLTEAGVYTDNLVSVAGCDSIVTLTLTVTEKVETNLEEAICKGGSFVFGSKTLTEAGVYTDNLVSVAGCDSVVTLTLTVLDKKETNLEESICKGGSFSFGGQSLTEAGVYTDNLLSVAGCDSIVTLTLTVLDKKETNLEETICKGESFSFGGNSLTATGVYEDKLVSASGCDSVVTLTLIVLEKLETKLVETICEGESFSFGGQSLTEAGVYEDKLISASGCDSIVTLTLILIEKKNTILEESICEGESFLFGGKSLTESGVYEEKLLSTSGCDSVVTLTLTVLEKKETTIEETICEGENFSFGGNSLTTAGLYEDLLPSESGCDSVVSLKLTVLTKKVTILDETIYNDESYTFGEKTLTESGVYEQNLTSESGCDSVVTLNLTVLNIPNPSNCLPIEIADYMSPNGDGIRDTWEIENLTCHPIYSVKIFDRYGKLLMEYANEYPGWDGYYLDHPMPSTDYWYVISIEDIDKEYTGHFTIIR
ncbi:MAG: T9SS type B sorting domain-containing protein [Paludibacteraceae bacterium]|nr:T9SS type B sorting domain-containing protein [Paludibacteraceae bacterium]